MRSCRAQVERQRPTESDREMPDFRLACPPLHLLYTAAAAAALGTVRLGDRDAHGSSWGWWVASRVHSTRQRGTNAVGSALIRAPPTMRGGSVWTSGRSTVDQSAPVDRSRSGELIQAGGLVQIPGGLIYRGRLIHAV